LSSRQVKLKKYIFFIPKIFHLTKKKQNRYEFTCYTTTTKNTIPCKTSSGLYNLLESQTYYFYWNWTRIPKKKNSIYEKNRFTKKLGFRKNSISEKKIEFRARLEFRKKTRISKKKTRISNKTRIS
jgi:hypothetical protein